MPNSVLLGVAIVTLEHGGERRGVAARTIVWAAGVVASDLAETLAAPPARTSTAAAASPSDPT